MALDREASAAAMAVATAAGGIAADYVQPECQFESKASCSSHCPAFAANLN